MPKDTQVIWLHAEAPAKPAVGQPCNGCGVCCAAAPCPVARVFLWQWKGGCRALVWDGSARHYRCGMLQQSANYLAWLPRSLEPVFGKLVARWIAAGIGCDSYVDADVEEEKTGNDAGF